MPRHPEPWFREGRGWYVQLDGKKTFVSDHPEHLPKPHKDQNGCWHPPQVVRDAFHRLMAGRSGRTPHRATIATGVPTVTAIIDAYFGWLKARVAEGSKAPRTLDWYRKYLASFLRFLRSLETPAPADAAEPPSLTMDILAPIHVYQWVDAQAGWKTGKRGAMIAVQRALNWAAKAGLLKSIGGRSPVAHLEKPQQGRRELLVSEEDYRELLAMVTDQEFRDVLELSWETGCRPHELFTVEAAHVELVNARWVFPVKLSKGKKVQRVVYLSDRALTITRRLAAERPYGQLLRNTDGLPWCVSSVKCRFQQLCRAMGRMRLKRAGLLPPKVPRLAVAQRLDLDARAAHETRVLERRRLVNELAKERGTRLNLYAFRHSRITESLVRGLDAVTVSILAGHRDTTMLARHYAHLLQKNDHMRAAANKAVTG